MKYCVENQLNLFEFHDSEFSLVSYEKNNLVVSVKHLNIHKDANENSYDYDMEIDFAKIIFSKFEVLSFEPMRTYKVDDDGSWHTDEPQIIFKDEDAESRLIDEIKKGITINGIDIREENNRIYMEISTCGQTCFFVAFVFDSVVVEWDKYCQKAWYELNKQYKYEILLATPNGEQGTIMYIINDEGSSVVKVGIKYQDKEIWAQGKDYLWVDAFANLQKQLPDGVIIKCCMTCRHGNMCPVGNNPGELFCTKDVIITQKSDLFFYTEDDNEREKRSRNFAHCCKDYQHQSWDFYTYNDYLYELNK